MTPPRQRLIEAALEMDSMLRKSTGLPKLSRKSVIFYTLATHALKSVNIFPLLVLVGPTSVGKSTTQRVIEGFAFQPNTFALRNLTLPVLRDELAAAHEGTAVVEEADQGWKDDMLFERMLSDRYHRGSAKAGLKENDGDSWTTTHKEYFGATILHRRLPFADAALDGRSITIRFQPNFGKKYAEFEENDAEIGRELVHNLKLELPDVSPPHDVAGRIFTTYRPIIAVAKICGDHEFIKEIEEELKLKTEELKEAQSVEPDLLVLRALVANLSNGKGKFDFRNIKFASLANYIWNDHRISLRPRQVGAIARGMRFETTISHGVSVLVPTPETLLRVCREHGYQDEAIVTLEANISKKTTEG